MDLQLLNTQLFLFVNHLSHNRIFLVPALILSGTGFLWVIWLILALLFIAKEKKHPKVIILFFLTLFSASAFTSFVLKPLFGSLRPEFVLNGITVYEMTSDFYSFPSSHSAVAFSGAVILSAVLPRYRKGFYVLASLIGLSRLYLGVHFPLDIIVGAVVGYGIGKLFLFINKRYHYTSF